MLAQLHSKLEAHFKDLASSRSSHGYPVYALEHGLHPEEIKSARDGVVAEYIRTGHLQNSHWLVWTVVAAEIGYTYDGDEYWQSFQVDIARKITLQEREVIRSWFHRFAAMFSGFTPSGRWAEHFTIIAWPITHSILPKYLQSLFARHLYESRHEIAARQGLAAEKLGQLLEDSYEGASSRFQSFLQQAPLTGRLVFALRDQGDVGGASPIYPPTLARITSDIEKKGPARAFLHDARRVLRDAQFRIQSKLGGPPGSDPNPAAKKRDLAVAQPKLIGRPRQDNSWALGVALPDIDTLLTQAGIDGTQLSKSRFRFSDQSDTLVNGKALLSYTKAPHIFSRFPAPHEPLVQFRQTDTAMRTVEQNLKLASQSPWLLRIHDDGVARQVVGNHVRSNAEYLIASQHNITSEVCETLALQPLESPTVGIHLYHLNVPAKLNDAFVHALSKLSIGYSLRANVRSFGLTPRWDDATGCSVWLLEEEPIFHLSADFPVVEFVVSVGEKFTLKAIPDARHECLISLGRLALGRHAVSFAATAPPSFQKGGGSLDVETVHLEVRAPMPWEREPMSRTGLRVVVDPPGASLEELISRKAHLSVVGPKGRTATVVARTYDMGGHVNSVTDFGRLEFPTTEIAIGKLLSRFDDEQLSEHIFSSPRVSLAFSLEEIGAAVASFPHTVIPLRWKIDQAHGVTKIRLVHEANTASEVNVCRYDLNAPDRRNEFPLADAMNGVKLDAPGALFVARQDGKFYSAFASVKPKGRIIDFNDLGAKVVFSTPLDGTRNITRLIAVLRFWRAAQPQGPLAILRKAKVLGDFEYQIEKLACGGTWAYRTRRFRQSGGRLNDLQADVGGSPGFASRIRTSNWNWRTEKADVIAEFARLARTYKVCSDQALCELALRLAFDPTSIRPSDPKIGADQIGALADYPALARGAYLARLAVDVSRQPPGGQLVASQ